MTDTESIMELLNFDALTLKEEVRNMSRNAGAGISQHTPQQKLVLFMTYLLTNRFSEVQELALRIVKDFVDRVGAKIETKQLAQFLLVVSEIKISKGCYEMWRDCLG